MLNLRHSFPFFVLLLPFYCLPTTTAAAAACVPVPPPLPLAVPSVFTISTSPPSSSHANLSTHSIRGPAPHAAPPLAMTPACLPYYTGVMAFTLIHFVAWAFAFVATPTAQFQDPHAMSKHGCYTMWGYRDFCGDVPYDRKGDAAFGCSRRTSTMHCAAAFAVMASIFGFFGLVGDAAFGCSRRTSTMHCAAAFAVMASIFGFFGLVFGILLNTQIKLPVLISFSLAAACIPCTLISWACVASVYNMAMCDGTKYKDKYPYTAGFALMVASWGLDIIAVGLLGITSWTRPPKEEEEEGEKDNAAKH
ncbi:amastin-like surface protein-like protein [Lotmaria passim]